MHWTVAAPFTSDPRTDLWLTPFVPDAREHFTMIAAPARPSWHARSTRAAGWRDWAGTCVQANAAWRASRGGVITVFPQLAVVAGLRRRIAVRHKPLVAWCFNLGALYGGAKARLARTALRSVDRIVVHARGEIARYSEWLDLERERFRFVRLQRAAIPITVAEDGDRPFVLAMGSARRDYATFLDAVRAARLPAVIVAARHALEGLEIPSHVEVRSGLTEDECRRLAQRARVNVIPVVNDETASGQVTLLEALRMGRAVVATRSLGSEDYVEHDRTGLLVPPRSVDALRDALERVWQDAALRARLGSAAWRFAEDHCSDTAAGAALGRVLREVEEGCSGARKLSPARPERARSAAHT
ncbi:MAG: glycosyltransferase [Planctomycetota bacterium]